MNVGRIKLRYVNLNNSYDVTLVQLSTHIHMFIFIEALGCEIVLFFKSLTVGGNYGNFSATGHVGA